MGGIIRPYQLGDAEKIYEFFSQYTSFQRDAQFWVWINRMLTENMYVQVIENEGKIVGHYGALPIPFIINGQQVKAALTLHIIMAPEFRNLAMLDKMMKQLYADLIKDGYVFSIGFPNQNMRSTSVRLDRVKQVALFNAYELESEAVKSIQKNNYIFRICENVTYSDYFIMNELMEKRVPSAVEIMKTPRYWASRYVNHPQNLYKIYRIYDTSLARIKGYIVCKLYEKLNKKYLHIIDYIFASDVIVQNVLNDFLISWQKEVDIFSFWKGDNEFESAIQNIGFKPVGFDTFLGVKMLNPDLLSKQQHDSLSQFNNWRHVMGESEAI